MAVQTHMNLRGEWKMPVPDYKPDKNRGRKKTKKTENKAEWDEQEHLRKAYESNKAAEEAKFQRENKGLKFQQAGEKEGRPATVSPANPLSMQQKRPPEVISAEQFSGKEAAHQPIPPEQHRAPTVQPFSNPVEEPAQQTTKKPRKRVRAPEMQEPGGAKTGGGMPAPAKAPRTTKKQAAANEQAKPVATDVANPFAFAGEPGSAFPPPPAELTAAAEEKDKKPHPLSAVPTFSSAPGAGGSFPNSGNRKYR